MSEYATSDSAFLNISTYLSNNCAAPQKPSRLVAAKFMGSRDSIPIYGVGFVRMDDDEKGRQCWAISFNTTLVVKEKMWEGIQKSPEQPRNVTLLGDAGYGPNRKMFDTDFRIYTYQEDAMLQGNLVSVRVDATALFIFHTLGYGDIPAEIAEIVKNGNKHE